MLADYLQQLERLLGFDLNESTFQLEDLTTFINMARRQVAAQGQCCRWLTPAGAPIESVEVTNGGAGYTNPLITVSGPDAPPASPPAPLGRQAVISPIVTDGVITDASVLDGGIGYFNPLIKLTDPTGAGAVLVPHVNVALNCTVPGQELYNFSDIDLGGDAGAGSILSIRNITLIWGSWQYTLTPLSFSKYMQDCRRYTNGQWLGQPRWWARYGQGDQGTVYLYPLPDQKYQMQWDCYVLPQDLIDDGSPELIPNPWRDAVPIYAAYLACLSMAYTRPSLTPLADKYYNSKDGGLFYDMMRRARAFSQPSLSRPVGVW
jgi:hypothetical protein